MRACVCEDELQELLRDCTASFVITDSDHIDIVQFARSSTNDNASTDDLNLRQVVRSSTFVANF